MSESKVKGNSFCPIASGPSDEDDFQEGGSRIVKKFPQCLATFTSTLGSFGLGCALAYTSPALPDLERRQDFGSLSLAETSWITSLAILGALISGPVAGFLLSRFGRRKTMLLMGSLFTLGWFCIGFARNVTMIHVGRFITGLTGGSFLSTIPVFVSEIAENELRGMLGSAMVLMLVSGILFVYTVGAVVSWWQLALICATGPFLCFLGLLFIPESPRYLLTQGKREAAAEALRWFRGATNFQQINPELSLLKLSVESEKPSSTLLGSSTWRNFLEPSALKPLGVTLILILFQQTSGVNAVQSYTVKIFQAASPNLDANLATIIIGVVQVVFVFLSMLLVDRVGRKILLILSFVIMAISLATLGTFFYLEQSTDHSWIPLAAVICFVIAYAFGVGPLPWVIFGEIISPNSKGFQSAIVTSVYWITAFISTKTFEDFATILGWHGYYWHLSVICVFGGLFTAFLIPETKGKSQEEIHDYFCTRKLKVTHNIHFGHGEFEQFNPKLRSQVDIDNNLNSTRPQQIV